MNQLFKFNILIDNSLKDIWKGEVFLLGISIENISLKTDFAEIFEIESLKKIDTSYINFSENIWIKRMRETFKLFNL